MEEVRIVSREYFFLKRWKIPKFFWGLSNWIIFIENFLKYFFGQFLQIFCDFWHSASTCCHLKQAPRHSTVDFSRISHVSRSHMESYSRGSRTLPGGPLLRNKKFWKFNFMIFLKWPEKREIISGQKWTEIANRPHPLGKFFFLIFTGLRFMKPKMPKNA